LLTIAQYRIHLDHSYDLVSPKPPYFVQPGPGQDNRGVEVEFNGNLWRGLDLSANYTNAMVNNRDGTTPTGQARHRLIAWLSYRFQHGALRDWSIAGGVLANSATQGLMTDSVTYFRIPGQARVDANVAYHTPRWSLTLGVRNLFDRNLRTDDFDETFMPLQPRRDVLLSGSWNF
jgi:iron complex outermembrane receptor protein